MGPTLGEGERGVGGAADGLAVTGSLGQADENYLPAEQHVVEFISLRSIHAVSRADASSRSSARPLSKGRSASEISMVAVEPEWFGSARMRR